MTVLTGDHAIHGTPAFIAPEQALGQAAIDGRADIYAVGCVAYWLLTGKLVFTAETPTALLIQHIQAPPSAPSAVTEIADPRGAGRHRAGVPGQGPGGSAALGARTVTTALRRSTGADAWTEERARRWWDQHQPRA